FDDPIELAKAIRKGPDMLPVEPGNSAAIPDGWIPVSERMPDKGTDVIVATQFFGPGDWRTKIGHINSDGMWHIYGASWTPTHWQPLPSAPKQEAE
ncbi:DUF551 domain-containing protein, partial [Escherichia coli]